MASAVGNEEWTSIVPNGAAAGSNPAVAPFGASTFGLLKTTGSRLWLHAAATVGSKGFRPELKGQAPRRDSLPTISHDEPETDRCRSAHLPPPLPLNYAKSARWQGVGNVLVIASRSANDQSN